MKFRTKICKIVFFVATVLLIVKAVYFLYNKEEGKRASLVNEPVQGNVRDAYHKEDKAGKRLSLENRPFPALTPDANRKQVKETRASLKNKTTQVHVQDANLKKTCDISTRKKKEISRGAQEFELPINCSQSLCSDWYKRICVAENVSEIVTKEAKRLSGKSQPVLFTMINDKYLELAYSWFCNTKPLGLHASLLVVTTDTNSFFKIRKDWPEITVVLDQDQNLEGNQDYSHVGYVKIMVRRTLTLLSLVMSNVEFMLVEMDSVWFRNAFNEIKVENNTDMLLNPFMKNMYSGGLFYVIPSARSKIFWIKLSAMMVDLKQRLKNCKENQAISQSENDQTYLSQLVNER